MSIEQRLEQVERQTKRLRIAVVVLATALCGVVSMAATESEVGVFDTVIAEQIFVKNDMGKAVVSLGTLEGGGGLVQTFDGKIGKKLVSLGADVGGNGTVTTYAPTGKDLVSFGSTSNGGRIEVSNKTGEVIVSLDADDYGNGEVGAWNRKGKGRVWDSQ
jgi:hypothetical protein